MAHIKELNNQGTSEPFFFLKPSSALLTEGPILVPNKTIVHHEIELVAILNRDLRNLDDKTFTDLDALDCIEGWALALDLTARNVQDVAKAKGLPWTIGKGFDTFCPISQFIPKDKIPNPYEVQLSCRVNGDLKQQDLTSLMIFKIRKILAYMSGIMTLKKGDIILTGTPKGVGPIVPGDVISGEISVNGKVIPESKISFNVEQSPSPWVFTK